MELDIKNRRKSWLFFMWTSLTFSFCFFLSSIYLYFSTSSCISLSSTDQYGIRSSKRTSSINAHLIGLQRPVTHIPRYIIKHSNDAIQHIPVKFLLKSHPTHKLALNLHLLNHNAFFMVPSQANLYTALY